MCKIITKIKITQPRLAKAGFFVIRTFKDRVQALSFLPFDRLRINLPESSSND